MNIEKRVNQQTRLCTISNSNKLKLRCSNKEHVRFETRLLQGRLTKPARDTSVD